MKDQLALNTATSFHSFIHSLHT